MLSRLLLLFIFFCLVNVWAAKKKVTVSGRLKCICPLANVTECQKRPLVQLWEDDDGPSHDDLLSEARVPFNGAFAIAGSEFEFFEIEPYLLITHYCPDGKEKQKRIDLLPVSSEKQYDLGIIPLAEYENPKWGN